MGASELMNFIYALYASIWLNLIIWVIKDTIKNEENIFSRKYWKTWFINIVIWTISILFLFGWVIWLIQNLTK